MEIASLGFRTDLRVLSLGGSEITDRGDHVVVRSPANPTFYWGNFILFEEPVSDVRQRLDLFAAEFPRAAHVAWGIDTTDGTAGDEAALTDAGFTIGRDTVMTATSVVEPERPNTTAVLRVLDGDADWAQQLELRLLTADGPADQYRTFLTRKIAAERSLCEGGRAVWFGAFEDGRLLSSLGLVGDGVDLARYQAVGTHPEARGRGLASTLVHHAARYGFDTLGAKTLVMVADPEYLAIRIYRRLGFAATEAQVGLTRAPSS